jgi:transposase
MHLTDEQWLLVQPLLPQPPPAGRRGRPSIDQRQILNGILWKLAARCSWRKLPASYPSSQVCYLYFRRWMQAGLLKKVVSALMHDVETRGQFDVKKAVTTGIVKFEEKEDCVVIYVLSRFSCAWQFQTTLPYYQSVACHLERKMGIRNFQPDPLEGIFQKEKPSLM